MSKSNLKVGFIGLGRMGQGMSRRILDAGHDVAVYDVVAQAVSTLVTAGARGAKNVAEVCKDRDVVVTMLADDEVVKKTVSGPSGMCDSMPPGSVHLAMGTYGVPTIRTIEAAHQQAKQFLVAAPVFGRPDLAAAGQISIAAAGPAEALERVDPLLKIMGRRIFQAGTKPELATVTKLANNLVLGCALQAMAEGFSLVRKYGVNPQVLYEVMTEGLFAGSVTYKVYGKLMVDDTYDAPGFTALLGLKDMNLIAEAANVASVPLPSGNVFRDRLLGAIAHGDGERDWGVVGREQARASGLE
jgi:3-hydroxyisobutyrate dehydrogenase-like beta-hydroxyacid dehydrogenase